MAPVEKVTIDLPELPAISTGSAPA
jgi:hypothetical protein